MHRQPRFRDPAGLSAMACAAPPMSFFISRMPDAGLMSRPPVSKLTPLPTTATRGWAGSPHSHSISRGSRARSAARPTAWMSGVAGAEILSARDGRLAAGPPGDRGHRVLQLLGTYVLGRRVDQVAHPGGGGGGLEGGLDRGGVGEQEGARAVVLRRLVPGEAVLGEEPADRGVRREVAVKAVGAGR